jgi:hypothetical protein
VLEALSVLVLDEPESELELEFESPDEPEPTPFGVFATLLLPPIVSVHVFSTRTAGCPWSSVTSVSLTVHVCVTATPEGLRGRSVPLHTGGNHGRRTYPPPRSCSAPSAARGPAGARPRPRG